VVRPIKDALIKQVPTLSRQLGIQSTRQPEAWNRENNGDENLLTNEVSKLYIVVRSLFREVLDSSHKYPFYIPPSIIGIDFTLKTLKMA